MKKNFIKILLLSVFCVSVIFFQNFVSTTMPRQIKIIDSDQGDTSGYDFTYSYGPALILDSNAKTIHSFSCTTGISQLGFHNWDAIRYSVSTDQGETWSKPKVVLRTSDSVNERATCDPSVVYIDGYYYLYYSGNKQDVQTVAFVARSANIDGPYLKYTNRGTWEENPLDPKIIISPRVPASDAVGGYGAGQQSVVYKDKKIYSWHTDSTTRGGIYFQTTTDPVKFNQGVETNVYSNDLSSVSVDVKYDPVINKFVMYSISMEHYQQAKIFARYSTDGITWTSPTVICDENCTSDFINNIGALGTRIGYLPPGKFLAYGAPFDLRTDCNVAGEKVDKYCWGKWDLYGAYYSNLTKPGGEIKGFIDSIKTTANGLVVNGWACSVGANVSVGVHVYLEGGLYVAKGIANLPSEPGVSSACSNSRGYLRYSVTIPAETIKANPGKSIYVYGLSPYGLINSKIANSGKFTTPNGEIKGLIDSVRSTTTGAVVSGWACATGANLSVNVHVYLKDSTSSVNVAVGTANLSSEPAVSQACSNSYSKLRFAITIPSSAIKANPNKSIYVYGISPFGKNNNSLINSGKYKVP